MFPYFFKRIFLATQHFNCMPRLARAVMTGCPHHLTQRGVDHQQVFFRKSDYSVYLDLIVKNADRFGCTLLGYCLMPNHVHWIVTPQHLDSLAQTFGEAHCRYASYANVQLGRSGHFWQNRFFSCMLDRGHFFTALRYAERNPVRSGIIQSSVDYPWSSAGAHAGKVEPAWLDLKSWSSGFTPDQWDLYVKADTFGEAEAQVRRNTYTGRPAGSEQFIQEAERILGRKLASRSGGRPSKSRVVAAKGGAE